MARRALPGRRGAARATAAVLVGVALVPFILTWFQINQSQRGRELFAAVRANDLAGVQALLKTGADPNMRDAPPPPHGPGEFIERLLNRSSDPARQPTPLLAALCVERRSAQGMNEVSYNPNPNPAILSALLSRGANANATDWAQTPPIAFAVASGNTEAVGTLLRYGAAVNQADVIGSTPLFVAAGQGRTRMMRYLIDHGADVHTRNTAKETTLIYTVRFSRMPDSVTFLLDRHVDPNLKDIRGKTALYYANNPDTYLAPSQTRLLPQVISLLAKAGAR